MPYFLLAVGFFAIPLAGYVTLYLTSFFSAPFNIFAATSLVLLGQFMGVAGGVRMLFERFHRRRAAVALFVAALIIALDLTFGFNWVGGEARVPIIGNMLTILITGLAVTSLGLWLLSLRDPRKKLLAIDAIVLLVALLLIVMSFIALRNAVG